MYGITLSVRVSVRPSVVRPSVSSFPDDNLRKCQRIFTEFGVCIDIVEIWFEIVNGQISSIFDSFLPDRVTFLCSFLDDNFSKCHWIFTKLGVGIDIIETWFGIADGQISSILTEISARDMSVFHFLTITLVDVNGFS